MDWRGLEIQGHRLCKQCEVLPGGGPLTDSHNATFVTLDLDLINARLRQA